MPWNPTARTGVRTFFISIVGAAILAACAGSSEIIYRKSFQAGYDFDKLMAFHGGKQMRLAVHGNPFDVPNETLGKQLSASMHGHNEGLPIDFTARPAPDAFQDTRIVVQFQPPASSIGRTACDGTGGLEKAPVTSRAGPVEALIAYCWQERELSSLRVRMGEVSSPDDPTFDLMIARATNLLLPRKDPFSGSETCKPNC